VSTPNEIIVDTELWMPWAFESTADEAEAVRIASSAPAARHDYVFSTDTAHAWRLAARLRGGTVGVNTAQRHPETPVVSDGGPFGLHGYSEVRSAVRTA
jgi:acyl-CoA reductase-like NAD-dependent aldehyde dehydrogenase